jgi:nicotinate-nucleotide pyrophosphorylase (carboxylating)
MIENPIFLDRVIKMALEEDLGAGDLTTDAIVDPAGRGKAVLLSRERLVLAGLAVFTRVFEVLSSDVTFDAYFQDGQTVPKGEKIGLLSGPLGAILKGERTALNFLQRMSGIATLTRRYVDKAGSQKVKVVDTRKTAPGLRVLDKYSVRMGGGFNHRLGLFDGILIKDNHIAAAGSVSKAVSLAKKKAPHTVKIEVEVEDLKGVEDAIRAGADAILLDNMSPEMMRKAVDVVAGRVEIEASGNINLENIEEVAKTGVNIISVGALTHSPRAVDLSLEVMKI